MTAKSTPRRKPAARAQATAPKKTAARKPAAKRAPARKPRETAAAGAALAASVAKTTGSLLGSAGKLAGTWLGRALRQPDVQRGLSFGALCAALVLSSSAVRAEVERWPAYQLDRQTLAVGEMPDELSAVARRDLERLPLPVDPTPFDARLVPAVHACLADLPWVEAVDQVRLARGGHLEFSLRARRPVARLGPNGRVVTSDGAVIAANYAADGAALPQVLHVPSAKRPVARRKAIEAAVAVLDALQGVLPIASIDVSNLGGRSDPLASEINLATEDGTVIEWGRRPEDDRPHMDAHTKLDNLHRFLQQGPSLGACERVSLRWDEVTFVPRPTPPLKEIAKR